MAQDTMVAEYRGVRVRREVADRREERYRREGKDCYLFAVSDDCVIDSTMRGTISRFTVRPGLPTPRAVLGAALTAQNTKCALMSP